MRRLVPISIALTMLASTSAAYALDDTIFQKTALRTGPSKSYPAVATIPKGQKIVITGDCVWVKRETTDYCPVRWKGKKGFLDADDLLWFYDDDDDW